jgi:hypothetical protein
MRKLAEEAEDLARAEQQKAELFQRIAQQELDDATKSYETVKRLQSDADAGVEEAERILREAKERQLRMARRTVVELERKNDAEKCEQEASRRRQVAEEDTAAKQILREQAQRMEQEMFDKAAGHDEKSMHDGSPSPEQSRGVPEWRTKGKKGQDARDDARSRVREDFGWSRRSKQTGDGVNGGGGWTSWGSGKDDRPSEGSWRRADGRNARWNGERSAPRTSGEEDELRSTEARREEGEQQREESFRQDEEERAEDEQRREEKRRREEEEGEGKQDEQRREQSKQELERQQALEESINRMKALREQEEAERREKQRQAKTQQELDEQMDEEAERIAREEQRKKEGEERECKERELRDRREAEARRWRQYKEAAENERTRCRRRDFMRWKIPEPGIYRLHEWPRQLCIQRFEAISAEFDDMRFSDSQPLTFESVPWPLLRTPTNLTVEDVDWSSVEEFFSTAKTVISKFDYKIMLEKAQRRFHPDKWRSRGLLNTVLDDDLRERLENAGNIVAQAITPLWIASRSEK